MKHLSYLFVTFIIVAIFVGCKETTKKNVVKPIMVTQEEQQNHADDSTIYGKCCEATTMNTLYIVDAKGDTLDFIIEDEANVFGGKLVGDKMAVISKNEYGENIAEQVINIMSLMGRWRSIDRDFEIKDGGVIESHQVAETKTFTSWKIFNGQLILAPDTFKIIMLGPDSLKLDDNKTGIYGFKRVDLTNETN